jgi:membrane glycosyltransferase
VLATWVFVATMGLLVLPKILSVVLLLTQRPIRRQFGGGIRASASVFVEVVASALVAPVMMIFQSIAVIEILVGRDAGWQAQRRDDGLVERGELYRKYGIPTLCGIMMAVGAYAVSLPLLLWMLPVIVGLLFAIPIGALTAKHGMEKLFITPEETAPPPVLRRANELAASLRARPERALVTLRGDATLLKRHLESLPPPSRRGPDEIDTHLAMGRARIEASDSFDEAMAHLAPHETLAVLNDPALLSAVLHKKSSCSNDV